MILFIYLFINTYSFQFIELYVQKYNKRIYIYKK